jgi:polyphosphate kinase
MLENAAKMRLFPQPNLRHLVVSPLNSRKRFEKLIDEQTALGKRGYILIKANHLTDRGMTEKLREAADAGVPVDAIVRTTYAMAPHENIRAISILDRYLEHQRVYVFGKGKDRKVFLGSSDLMERNLDWRLEVAFPVYDPQLRQIITDTMAMQVNDTFKARILDEHQSNQYVGESANGRRAQEETYRYFRDLFAIPDNGHTQVRVPKVAPAEAESAQE